MKKLIVLLAIIGAVAAIANAMRRDDLKNDVDRATSSMKSAAQSARDKVQNATAAANEAADAANAAAEKAEAAAEAVGGGSNGPDAADEPTTSS